MSAEITITIATAAAPTVVSKEALRAFYNARVVGKPDVVKMKVVSGQPGQTFNFVELGDLTVAGIAAAGTANANTEWTHTARSVALTDWRGTNIRVAKVVTEQSSFEYMKEFGIAAAGVLGEDMDIQILADYANFTTNVLGSSTSTSPDAFTDAHLRGALARIENQSVRRVDESMSAVLAPVSWYQLLADSDFKRADALGAAKGVHVSGVVLPIYGLKVLVTPGVGTSGANRANLIFSQKAIGFVLNKDISIEKHDKLGDFSDAYLGWWLGGSAFIQQQAGCVVYTAA